MITPNQVLWVTGLAAVALLGWRVQAWHAAYEELPAYRDALVLEQTCGEGSKCKERENQALKDAANATVVAVTTFGEELASLRNRPARVVRVCNEGGSVPVPGPATDSDGGSPDSGVVHGPTGRDIGRELYDLAADADKEVARLRALQQWNRSLYEATGSD